MNIVEYLAAKEASWWRSQRRGRGREIETEAKQEWMDWHSLDVERFSVVSKSVPLLICVSFDLFHIFKRFNFILVCVVLCLTGVLMKLAIVTVFYMVFYNVSAHFHHVSKTSSFFLSISCLIGSVWVNDIIHLLPDCRCWCPRPLSDIPKLCQCSLPSPLAGNWCYCPTGGDRRKTHFQK